MSWAAVGGAAVSVIGGAIMKDSAGNAVDAQTAGTDRAADEQKRQYDTTRSDLAPYREAGSAALSRLRALMGLGGGGGGGAGGADYQSAYDRIYGIVDANHKQQYGMALADSQDKPGLEKQLQQIRDAANAEVANQSGSGDNYQQYGDSPLLRRFTTDDLNADPVYNSGLKFGLDQGTKAINARAIAGGGYDSGATLKALTRYGNDYGSTKAEGAYSRYKGDQSDVFSRLSGMAGMGSGATNVGINAGANTASNLSNLYSSLGNAQGAAAIAGGNAMSSGLTGAYNNYSQNNLLKQLTGGGARSLTGTDPISEDFTVTQG